MSRFLGLDGGGSATRWAICDAAGAELARGELQPVTGHLFRPDALAAFSAFAAALRTATAGHRLAAVVAGITGLTGDAPEAARAAAILADALGVPVGRVRVEDDLWIGYHAVLRPGEGHAVYAGTGSVGLHLRADGGILRVGGRGMLIDDAGSAFWIGREGLNLLYRRIDAGEPPGGLGAALFAAIGGADWNAVRAHVYGGTGPADGRAAVAMLARAVARAAGGGDAGALDILHRAGVELARLALALTARAGVLPVAVLGRAATLHPAILTGLRAAAPGLEIRQPAADAALAAARLAGGHLAASGSP